jgi:penicillin-binding protein A
VFGLFALLFAVLIGFTSQWSIFEAEGLENNPDNRRALLLQETIPRGLITAADETELAVSEQVEGGENPRFERRYPEGELFSHAVGYSFTEVGRSGLEQYYNDDLSGQGDDLENLFGDIVEQEEGDGLLTNLDPEAQQTAIDSLGGQPGSVVAIEPSTGQVRVMASVPAYDPNTVPDQLDELNQAEESPLFNRATQSGYLPGSTFKVVTAAAALESGDFTPESVLDGSAPATIGGAPLENAEGAGGGPVPLTDALTFSVNTAFARLGEELGTETLFDTMERFGFFRDPPIDYPGAQLLPSGVYEGEDDLVEASEPVDVGRVAIGQERLQVTPLQMAMVAAAVANDGELMAPRLGDAIIGTDGRVTDRLGPVSASRVMSPENADALATMMQRVVDEGTGTSAQIGGVAVAGKTGTAEVLGGAANTASFLGFAPVDDPQVAVFATIEETQSFGGDVAAPIARDVMEALLDGE